MHDELMSEPQEMPEKAPTYAGFFQFGEDEPIRFATVVEGYKLSITLDGSATEIPEVNFSDGKGNSFKMFLKKI